MYPLIRFILFFLSAEKAHHVATFLIKLGFKIPIINGLMKSYFSFEHPSLKRTVFGLEFKNPVGLGAGFDKNASYYEEMGFLGFGFVEIGTVTPLPQDGNAQPRLFRLPQDEALINRMGFNNDGMFEVTKRLSKRKKDGLIIGGNIGKNKDTPNEHANHDYLKSFAVLFPFVDYFVINVSSPNTPNLRELQEKEPLQNLLQSVQNLNASFPERKPLLLKIAPDLTNEQLDDIVEIALSTSLDGIIAINTTIDRSGLLTDAQKVSEMGAGGLSGRPLVKRSTEVIKYLHEKSNGAIPIIGVGGIHSAEDAQEKLEAGASLIQLYTGFIYEGPGLIKKINKSLVAHAK